MLAIDRDKLFLEVMKMGRKRLLLDKPILEKKKRQLQGKQKTMALMKEFSNHSKNIDAFTHKKGEEYTEKRKWVKLTLIGSVQQF